MTSGSIRFRAVALGLVLGLCVCAVTPLNNLYLGATPLGGGHFPLAPFFVLAWLTVATAGLGRLFRGRMLLTGTDLLVCWMLMVVVSGVAHTGLARTFFISLTAPLHFATEGNQWNVVLGPLLPSGWYPTDPEAVETLYNGLSGGYTMPWGQVLAAIPWGAWVGPLATWAVFIGLCYFVLLCLTNLFSRQWVSNERMNFPLLRLPEMLTGAVDTGGLGGFFSDRFLLSGLFFSVALHTINGIAFYDPSVPQIPTLILAGPYFPKTGLFSGFTKLKIYFYPAFIGFAYLTARQISLSFWLFFLLGGLVYGIFDIIGQHIPASALGVTFGPTLTSPEETQMIGAYGVFFIFLLWLARHHLYTTAKDALRFRFRGPDEAEWVGAPASLWGLILGGGALTAWSVSFGLPLGQAVLLLGAFFMVMLVASRIICQGGIAYFTLTAAPTDGLLAFFGTGIFSRLGILMAAVMQKMLFVDLRESLLPSLFHAAKVGEKKGPKKLYLAAIVLAIAAAVAVSFLAMLAVCHKYGLRDLQVDWEMQTVGTVYENVQRLLEAPAGANRAVIGFTVAGAAVMLALVIAYQHFYWWPIHPLGFLTMYSSSMRILWFSFFLGWLCNHLTLRYGGIVLMKRVRLLFIGLILGDFLMGGAYALIGLWTGQSYLVLPN
ncbi:hypothetical protein GTA51_07685 [Desulfovibrio aerotolerans]|uniref:Uncharacterized protein n=1 Tax=Solidesulfovibrio aerotolerans TaxID=295255 RepID=A0A7C9NJ68_9BACT|nr:DUF6785 family protein [Solidesulfovibrio aerotolerans]MYL83016.1 hypothetical protein [Solidesulfovibrio aerotolerans]